MKHIWLDVDPGHDDATAILLAVCCGGINVLGVSTVHGNATAENTAINAARCLYAYGAPETVRVYPGAARPLLRAPRHDPEIHGADGLGGVVGLPDGNDPRVRDYLARKGNDGAVVRALEGMSNAIQTSWREGNKVSVVSSGPMTNIALFVSAYPDLLEGVEEFVFMGGGVGLGNRSAVAEFNILCDPESAQIVFDAPVKKTMIPLNVTHTAILTRNILARLLSPAAVVSDDEPLPEPSTRLRHMLSTLIIFFSETYKSTFGFNDGPPLHDALTIAYVAHPEMFTCRRYRVDVELQGLHTSGETVVDVWGYRSCDDTWGVGGKNCIVAEAVDVEAFFDFVLQCISRCDKYSPLNV